MKICRLLIVMFLVLLSTNSYALRPPQYLSVPEWQSCTRTESHRGYQTVCLPRHRPHGCPKSSWRQLMHRSSLPFCRRY